jgi:predicted permease
MRSLTAFVRALIERARFEREMSEELRLHIEHRADDLVASGLDRERAVRQARLEFGAVESYKEQCRDARGFAPLRIVNGLSGDLKLGARRLAAAPLFTTFAVLSLALGVGITTAVYSVVDSILWKELGIHEPDEVVLVAAPQFGRYNARGIISQPDFKDLREAQKSFSSITASYLVHPAVETSAGTELLPAEAVDGWYFSTLGVRAAKGRTIQPADDSPAAAVVVLSHSLWRTRFGADAEIVGKTVRISGRPFEIIGVAPASFGAAITSPLESRLWIPLGTAEWFSGGSTPTTTDRDRGRLTVIGRLRLETTSSAASVELATIAAALDAAHPLPNTSEQPGMRRRGWRAATVTSVNEQEGGMGHSGLIVLGLGALVLMVACTNLANLVLARGTARQQEFAVRRALGASRWRLVREQCAENLILVALGGIAAWLVLQGLILALNVEISAGKFSIVSVQPQVSVSALTVAATALLLSLLVFGLEPALQLTRTADVRRELAASAAGVGAPSAKRQRAFLRWQVAISTGFFIISSLCVRYLVAEARHDSGVEMDRIGIALLGFPARDWDEVRARRTLDLVLEHGRNDRDVEAVSVSSGLPFGTTRDPLVIVSTPDHPILPNGIYGNSLLIAATPGFFRTIGVAILQGRGFDDRDDAGAPPVIVPSEATARRLFGTSHVVGRQLLVKDPRIRVRGQGPQTPVSTVTIIGIARDTDVVHLFSRNGDVVYMPFAQAYQPYVAVVARAQNAAVATRAVRNAIRRADPELGIQVAGTGRMVLAGAYVNLRGMGVAAVSLGALTLFLAMVGLYGVQSQIVTYRTREIGVRMSFGASAEQIKRMVLKDGYGPVLQGLAIGLFIGISGRAIIQSLTPAPIGIFDPWMLVLVPIPLILAAFCACYLPAHRASQVDPNVALRHL